MIKFSWTEVGNMIDLAVSDNLDMWEDPNEAIEAVRNSFNAYMLDKITPEDDK